MILKLGRLTCLGFDLFQVVQKLGSVATNAQDMFKRLFSKAVHMIDEFGRTNLSKRLRNILNTFMFSHRFVPICQVCRCLN